MARIIFLSVFSLVLLGSCSIIFPHTTKVVKEDDENILERLTAMYGNHTYYYLSSGMAALDDPDNVKNPVDVASDIASAEAKKSKVCPTGIIFLADTFIRYEYGAVTVHFYCEKSM